jgi:hypothetical protein
MASLPILASDPLSGLEKAATLMMALGNTYSGEIWSQLSDEEVKELSTAMSNLGPIQAPTVEQLFVEFASQVSSTWLIRKYRAPAGTSVAKRPRIASHGRNSRACGPYDVGQAGQRQ